MHPRLLQATIHSDFSTSSGVWANYRSEIESLASESYQDLNDHLIREFNKKIRDLGQSSNLYFTPNDAGLRFLGSLSPVDAFFILNSDGSNKLIRPSSDSTTENIISPDSTYYNVEP